MNNKSILTHLSRLTPEVRSLVETELREAGLLAQGAPLEEAFLISSATRDEACEDDCQKEFDETMETCTTDACKFGAALKYARCLKKCGTYD